MSMNLKIAENQQADLEETSGIPTCGLNVMVASISGKT